MYRIVQNNNQMLGSPVNRIRITGTWASRSLAWHRDLTLRRRAREYVSHMGFVLVMFTIDFAFWMSKVKQWVKIKLGLTSEGFEDELEKTMRGFAKNNFGVEMSENAFEG